MKKIMLTLICYYLLSGGVFADVMDTNKIYTQGMGKAKVTYPDWFKNSFYDIPEDMADAKDKGKKGVALFISQKNCNHCESMVRLTLQDKVVTQRLQKNYDVVGMDIFNDLDITKPDGSTQTIAKFVQDEKAYLTPSMIFYHPGEGRVVKIVGFYPPEKFSLVMDYLDGQHYKQTSISRYLRSQRTAKQATEGNKVKGKSVNESMYQKIHNSKGLTRPTMVLFTQPDCNPCDRFFDRVLSKSDIRKKLRSFNAFQVDTTDNNNQIKTPQGKVVTPQQWMDQLDLSYDISAVFFDEKGKEVFRLDAESGHSRVLTSMKYVLAKGYLEENQVQRWVRKTKQQELKTAKR